MLEKYRHNFVNQLDTLEQVGKSWKKFVKQKGNSWNTLDKPLNQVCQTQKALENIEKPTNKQKTDCQNMDKNGPLKNGKIIKWKKWKLEKEKKWYRKVLGSLD